jgi:hypothetical protein
LVKLYHFHLKPIEKGYETFPVSDAYNCDITINIALVTEHEIDRRPSSFLNVLQKTHVLLAMCVPFKVATEGNPASMAHQRNYLARNGK